MSGKRMVSTCIHKDSAVQMHATVEKQLVLSCLMLKIKERKHTCKKKIVSHQE